MRIYGLERIPNFRYSDGYRVFSFEDSDTKMYPNGTLAISIQDKMWVTKIPTNSETIMLLKGVIARLLKENKTTFIDLRKPYLVQQVIYVIKQIISCSGIIFHRCGWVEDENKNITGFKFGDILIGHNVNVVKREVQVVCTYLKRYQYKIRDVNPSIITLNNPDIKFINNELLSVKTKEGEDVLYFKFDRSFYLTNLKVTQENIFLILKLLEEMTSLRSIASLTRMAKHICPMIVSNVAAIIRRVVSIRPSYLCRTADGINYPVHRSFISPERISPPMLQERIMELAKPFLLVKDVVARDEKDLVNG